MPAPAVVAAILAFVVDAAFVLAAVVFHAAFVVDAAFVLAALPLDAAARPEAKSLGGVWLEGAPCRVNSAAAFADAALLVAEGRLCRRRKSFGSPALQCCM